MGQTSAQTLGNQNLTSSGQVASTLTNTGQQLGTDFQNAGAATASGYVGAGNAWGGGVSGAASSLSQMALLQKLMKGSSATGSTAGLDPSTFNSMINDATVQNLGAGGGNAGLDFSGLM